MSFLNLEDKLILVAGGGGGIGSHVAQILGQCAARVAIADLNIQNAKAIAGEISQTGTSAAAYHLDVSSEQSTAKNSRKHAFARFHCSSPFTPTVMSVK